MFQNRTGRSIGSALLLAVLVSSAALAQQSPRERTSINFGWRFTKGDPAGAERKIAQTQSRHRDRLAFVPNPDAGLVRRLHAAADIVMIPARKEPCGIKQMIAMRYGALPVARATGGLVDTVVDVDSALTTGTGVLFDEDSAEALAGAVGRALAAFVSPRFPDLRRRIMRQDLGWDRPARRHAQLYRRITTGG